MSVPLYFGLLAAYAATFPIAAAALLVRDLATGSRLGGVRGLLTVGLYLSCECGGILAAFALWCALPWTDRETFLGRNARLQAAWANAMLRGLERIFRLTIVEDGDPPSGAAPVLVLARHTSIADTILPAVYLSRKRGLRLRWVLKRELLWDPCLDIVGQRLPNDFIRRGRRESSAEIELVEALGRSLGPSEGVVIYPEGTRFTEQKRARRLAAANTDDQRRRVERFERVLPPERGGALSLLRAAPGATIVFLGHVGFDRLGRLSHFFDGAPVGRTIRLRYWRAAPNTLPASDEARAAWLDDRWAALDAWVKAQDE